MLNHFFSGFVGNPSATPSATQPDTLWLSASSLVRDNRQLTVVHAVGAS
jgi:hypothetical protein